MLNKNKVFLFFLIIFSVVIFILGKIIFTFKKPKSVILITIDALRPDHLGCYGYSRNTSPHIDRLAQKGILFTQAISTGTWTLSSIPSILTSLFQSRHGIFTYGDKLSSESVTLAEIFKRNGYKTAFIGPLFFSEMKGLESGFDYFSNKLENEKADYLTNSAIEYIKQYKKERFFLWLHYFDPHTPYKPPEPYNKIFLSVSSDEIQKKIGVFNPQNPESSSIPDYAFLEGKTELTYYISQYDGEIRFVDDNIGRLMNLLSALNLDKDALIIITSDHGECLGEQGIYFIHGGIPLDTVIRVPLVVYYDKFSSKKSKIECQVSLIDIAPTILEFLRVKRPKAMIGRGLLGLINKETECLDGFSYIENGFMSAIRTPEWKLIHIDYDRLAMFSGVGLKEKGLYEYTLFHLKHLFKANPEYILFNLKEDPNELINVADKAKEKLDFLKEKLDMWRISFPSLKRFKDGHKLDEQTIEYLKGLGYVQ